MPELLSVCALRLQYAHRPRTVIVMKRRKNLSLSAEAIARGEQIAAEKGKSLSAIIEEQLLAIVTPNGKEEDYWPAPPMKRVAKPHDPRTAYLKRKHG